VRRISLCEMAAEVKSGFSYKKFLWFLTDMKTTREVDERWLCILFGELYEAEFKSSGGVHVHDRNGDEVLTYTAGVGWYEKEWKAEMEVHGALKAAYYDAFRAARQETNFDIAGMKVQGGFDARV